MVVRCSDYGVVIYGVSQGFLEWSNFTQGEYDAIWISETSSFEVSHNIVFGNWGRSLRLESCDNCLVYDNYFGSSPSYLVSSLVNVVFNIEYQEGLNIVGGPYLGGNFWVDYDGPDRNWDGIIDEPLGLVDAVSGEVSYYDLYPLAIDVFIYKPADGTTVYTGPVTFYWLSPIDPRYIDHYEVALDGGDPIDVGLATQYTFDLEEGWHYVDVWLYHVYGYVAHDRVSVYAGIGPEPWVVITSPEDCAYLNTTTVTVEWFAAPMETVDYFTIRLDAVVDWIDVDKMTSYTFENLAPGKHFVVVRVHDIYGNIPAWDAHYFFIDIEPPEAHWVVEPPDDIDLPRLATMATVWLAWDFDSPDVYRVELIVYNITSTPSWITWKFDLGRAKNYTLILPRPEPTTVSQVVYKIVLKFYDKAGNIFKLEKIVTIHSSPPNPDNYWVRIILPANGSTIEHCHVTVVWICGDEGSSWVDHFEICLDNGSWVDVGKQHSYVYHNIDEGWHTVVVRAYAEGFDHYAEDTVVFYVEHQRGGNNGSHGAEIATGLGAAVLLAVATTVLLMKKKLLLSALIG